MVLVPLLSLFLLVCLLSFGLFVSDQDVVCVLSVPACAVLEIGGLCHHVILQHK